MTSHLYIFAGFPGKQAAPGTWRLGAGGLEHCIENIEELAILENDPTIRLDKEGVILVSDAGEEWSAHFDYVMSPMLERDGITWDWFPEKWSFGNGVTMHKTLASPDYRTVVHGTDLTLDQFLAIHGPTNLAALELVKQHNRHEGWRGYEARWLPGTCPQVNHVVHLTWLVATHKLPDFAYERIRELIEDGAEPGNRHLYDAELGKHFSEVRRYGGKPGHGGPHALPVH